MGALPTSQVLDELAPFFGFALPPSTSHVLDEEAPDFGFNSLPFHTQVLEEDAPLFGLISLPSKTQVFEDEAPLFGFNSFPSQTQPEISLPFHASLGIVISLVMGVSLPLYMASVALGRLKNTQGG